MTGKALIKLLAAAGWTLYRIHGSHHILVKDGRRGIPVPVHGNKDLPKGLVAAIKRQAGLKERG